MEFKNIADIEIWEKALKEMDATEAEKPMNKLIDRIQSNKDKISHILGLSAYLEGCINSVIEAKAISLNSNDLIRWSKNLNITTGQKLRVLRFLNLIDEKDYAKMRMIFKVRNGVAHKNLLKENKEDNFRFIPLSNKLIKHLKLDTDEKKQSVKLLLYSMDVARQGWKLELLHKVITKSPKKR
jgi:hypothetical protein